MDTLTSPSTPISAAEAARVAATCWDLGATATPLPGERDSNFRLEGDGARYFLKVAHAAESETAMNLETAALLHVEREAPHLDVQRVVRTAAGEAEATFEDAAGETRRARLTTFLEGDVLTSLPIPEQLAVRVGRTSGELGQALASFEHPGARRRMLWDTGAADQVRDLIDELGDVRDPGLLAAGLDRFGAEVRPRLRGLRAQFLHNDVNRNNTVLLDSGAVGVIDFGDAVHTQVVCDLAVSVTDFLLDEPEPWARAIALLRGFHRVRRLRPEELELLVPLVRTRLTLMIVITEWRMKRFPENRDYIARKTERCWSLLGRLDEADDAATTARLEAACRPS